jgi:hypothetical protein
MGEVYRARDSRLDRDVAVKVLASHSADDPGRLARFEREARLLAALNHPNIAQVFGIEQSTGGPAIVMELVEGTRSRISCGIGTRPAGTSKARREAGATPAGRGCRSMKRSRSRGRSPTRWRAHTSKGLSIGT